MRAHKHVKSELHADGTGQEHCDRKTTDLRGLSSVWSSDFPEHFCILVTHVEDGYINRTFRLCVVSTGTAVGPIGGGRGWGGKSPGRAREDVQKDEVSAQDRQERQPALQAEGSTGV